MVGHLMVHMGHPINFKGHPINSKDHQINSKDHPMNSTVRHRLSLSKASGLTSDNNHLHTCSSPRSIFLPLNKTFHLLIRIKYIHRPSSLMRKCNTNSRISLYSIPLNSIKITRKIITNALAPMKKIGKDLPLLGCQRRLCLQAGNDFWVPLSLLLVFLLRLCLNQNQTMITRKL